MNRRYAFDSYSGTNDGPPFRDENGTIVPVDIPMSAFLSGSCFFLVPKPRHRVLTVPSPTAGPLAGGSFPPEDLTPRAVRKSYFKTVCSHPKLLDKAAIRAKLPENYTALHLLAVWVRMMDDEPARCVEINERIFDVG